MLCTCTRPAHPTATLKRSAPIAEAAARRTGRMARTITLRPHHGSGADTYTAAHRETWNAVCQHGHCMHMRSEQPRVFRTRLRTGLRNRPLICHRTVLPEAHLRAKGGREQNRHEPLAESHQGCPVVPSSKQVDVELPCCKFTLAACRANDVRMHARPCSYRE